MPVVLTISLLLGSERSFSLPHFSSIFLLYQYKTGQVPSDWVTANDTPVFKKRNRASQVITDRFLWKSNFSKKFLQLENSPPTDQLACFCFFFCFFFPVWEFWLWSCKGISKPFLPFPKPSGFAAPLPKLCARLWSRWLLLLTATTVFVMLLLLLPPNVLRLLSRYDHY